MRTRLLTLLLILACCPVKLWAADPGYTEILSDGTEIEYSCMSEIPGAAQLANPKIRFVFIRFPQTDEGGHVAYPMWTSWLVDELTQYFKAMSVNMQQPTVEVVTDPDNPGRPWTADSVASYYAPLGACNSVVNHEVFMKIHNAYLTQYPNGYWAGVDYIFVIAYDQAYGTTYSNPGGFTCGGVVPGGSGVPGLTAAGFAEHLFLRQPNPRDAFDTGTNNAVASGVAHEYGHVLGMGHSPYSGNYTYPGGIVGSYRTAVAGPCEVDVNLPPRYHLAWDGQHPCGHGGSEPWCPNPCGGPRGIDPSWNCGCIRCGHPEAGEPPCTDPIYINVGHYDMVRGISMPGGRIAPYHPVQLIEHTSWLTAQMITTDFRDFHIPQLRNLDPDKRKVYMIQPAQSPTDEYFLLSNHQGNANDPILQFDARYAGHGLLIWHVKEARIWDLESASGEVPDANLGQPFDSQGDPPYRGDQLARSWGYPGDALDFFPQSGVADFSATTNPNSNYYVSVTPPAVPGFFTPQTVLSHIGVENVRQGPGPDYDIIADIYVDPTQYVTAPNGGEYVPEGAPLTIRWLRRPAAGISTVNIFVSSDGGQSWGPLVTGLPNPMGSDPRIGQYVTAPFTTQTPGSQWRVKVTSFDASMNASDESDANFTVWEITDASIQQTVTQDCNGTIKFDITWNTTVSTDGWDSLLVYAPGGNCGSPALAQVARAASQGTSHHVIWQGTCQTGAWTYLLKSTKGAGVTTSGCKFANMTECWTQTAETPGVIETSMEAWDEASLDPEQMELHFYFGTTQCATEFEVQYRVQGTSNWWTLTCSSPGSSCVFNANKTYERIKDYYPCETTHFQWRVKAKNWNGWHPTYTSIKTFKAYCIEQP